MRPIDRLSTHDSTMSTVVASSSSGASSTTAVSNSATSTNQHGEQTPIPRYVSRRHSNQAQTQHQDAIVVQQRPHSRSIRRLRSLRDRANSRFFHRDRQNASHVDDTTHDIDVYGLHSQDSDVVMGGTSAAPPTMFHHAAGSAARAAAAEHNHGKAAAQYQEVFHYDHDEDLSDDVRMAKKRRGGTRKFSSVVDSGDNGYDSMEIDNGLDEFTDRRRSKPPARKGQLAHDATFPVHTTAAAHCVSCCRNNKTAMRVCHFPCFFTTSQTPQLSTMAIQPMHPTKRRKLRHQKLTVLDIVGKLPTEIAADIFSYLDDAALIRCKRVSRRWQHLAQSSAVWRASFLGRYSRAKDNVLPYIQFGGQGLGRLEKQQQEWERMAKARRQIQRNWRGNAPKAVYFVGHTDSVYCCQFDEDKIITGSRDRTIRVWDLHFPYRCRKVIGGPQARPVRPQSDTPLDTHPTNTVHQNASLNGTAEGDLIYHIPSDFHTASILCLQFDKEIMVTGSSDHSCIVWDIKTFEPIKRLVHHTAGVLDVCMDDEYIISCSKDAHICVWDRKTLTLIKALHGHRGPVNAVQLREINGEKLLVSASGDGLAKIWDLRKLDIKQQFNSQDRGLAAVEFSDDGRYVLAGGNDQVIYKFDSDTQNLEHTFRGHSSLVRSLFLDSANARVVSGSYDQGIRVYDFNNGELIGSYDNWTTSWILAAKGDYRRIVATSQDGRALLMDFGYGVKDADLLAGIDVPKEIERPQQTSKEPDMVDDRPVDEVIEDVVV